MPGEVLQTCPKCRHGLPELEWCPSQWGTRGRWCRRCLTNARYLKAYQRGEIKYPFKVAYWRYCEPCGQGFQSQKEYGQFCSRKCKDDSFNAAWAKDNADKKPAERVCPHCGATFGRHKRADARFCSQKCEQAAHNQFRKAVRRGASDPDRGVSMARVMTRCKGRCHICGKKAVDPTLDHIIPVSLGGSHTEDNLAIACLSCNCARGNRFLN